MFPLSVLYMQKNIIKKYFASFYILLIVYINIHIYIYIYILYIYALFGYLIHQKFKHKRLENNFKVFNSSIKGIDKSEKKLS